MNWTTTPAEFIKTLGWKAVRRGNWLTTKHCPFCGGGNGGDTFTFAVHATDGNFFCHRAKCGESGSFWGLIERVGQNPKDYLGERDKKNGKKRFIYS